jgi:hypothetical protein
MIQARGEALEYQEAPSRTFKDLRLFSRLRSDETHPAARQTILGVCFADK